MAVAFVSSSASTTNTTTITKPSGLSVGDTLLVVTEDASSTLTISGSTFLDLGTYRFGGGNNWLRVFARVIDGTEGSTFTASASTNYKCLGYSGVVGLPALIGGLAYPVTSVTSLDSRYRAPVDGMVVHVFSTSGTSNPVITAPGSGVTDRGGWTNRTFWAVDVCDETVTAGDDNTRTATQAGGTSQLGNTLAFMLPSAVSIPAAVGSATNSGNSTNASITIPSTAQVGDMFICAFSTIAAAGAISAGPTGFTALDGPGNNTGGSQRSNYWWGYKILVSGDPGSTINVTSGSQVWGAAGVVIRNPNGILATGTMTHGTSTTPPLVNTAGGGPAGIAVSALIFSNSSGNSGHTLDNATIKGVTWRSDIAVASGFGAAALAVHGVPPSGSALAPVVTLTSSPTWETNTVILALGASGSTATATGAHTSGATADGVVGTAATATGAHVSGATAVGSVVAGTATGAHVSGATAAGVVGTAATATGAHTSGGDADGTVVAGLSRDATGDHTADATADGTVASALTALAIHVSSATAAGVVGTVATASGDHTTGATAEGTDVVGPNASAQGDHVSGATAEGVVTVIPQTITDWTGGRVRDGIATAFWEPPVIPLPDDVLVDDMRGRVIDAVHINEATGEVTIDHRTVSTRRAHYRVKVGHKDITVWRGSPTPPVTFNLLEPLLYGSGRLVIPQVDAVFETPGQGHLSFLAKHSEVHQQRTDPVTHEILGTDYIGFISDHDHSGPSFACTLGGQATGRLELPIRPPTPFANIVDIGRLLVQQIRQRARLNAHDPPTTGVKGTENGPGGSELDYMLGLTAKSTQRDGTQWTVMPNKATGHYRVIPKDGDTIHFTVYFDDELIIPQLIRDYAVEPDVVWATAIAPDGRRIMNMKIPGLATGPRQRFPLDDHAAAMHPGDTDADTDTGAGVTALIWRLWQTNRLPLQDPSFVWTTADDDPVTEAILDLQDDADLHQTGNVNFATWRALWDMDINPYSLRGARIVPFAQRAWAHPWRFNASGQRIGRNPRYVRSRIPVHAQYDMGPGHTETQVKKWSKRELSTDTPNWTGQFTVAGLAVIRGEHNPGDPFDETMLMDAREITPNMNAWAPLWQGQTVDDLWVPGTKFHVVAVDFDDAQVPRVTVDTRMRDAMKVWEEIARNRESRQSPQRVYIAQNRSSNQTKDAGALWDRSGGRIGPVPVKGATWTYFEVPAGREGSARDMRLQTDPPAEYAVAFFGHAIDPKVIDRRIGDPFTDDGRRAWRRHQHLLKRRYWMNYSAGTGDNPCGYSPSTKADLVQDLTDPHHPDIHVDPQPTGEWEDSMTWPYFCVGEPVLRGLIYADRDTTLQGGRIMTLLVDDQI